MIGMQYKITLPKDFDMGLIRKRVRENGHKTDGFPGLQIKAYLMTRTDINGNLYNSYAPLYIWNNAQGMNHFIFDGFFDNILTSFGWQHIEIGVPLSINVDNDLNKSKYVLEYAGNISKRKSLINTRFHSSKDYVKNEVKCLGSLLVYNPDKWGYSHFSFYQEKPEIDSAENLTIYEVLHVSQ